MGLAIISFLFLFCLPMSMILAALPPDSLLTVALQFGAALLLFALALLAPRLVRRLRRRRMRVPSAAEAARLDWPASLTRGELEAHCLAWLRAHGWQAMLATDHGQDPEAVYVMASRGGATVALLCDLRGEEQNPAVLRAFAQGAAALGASRFALVTLSGEAWPHPAEVAARRAGVRLLRVAELPTLETLLPAADMSVPVPVRTPVAG